MAIRFYSEFTSERGNTYRVNIYDMDFSGVAEEFSSAAPGFVLSYYGGKDVFSPLMPSTCTLHMMVQTAAQQTLLTDLSDFQEGKFIIELREDPDGTDLRHWLGMLTPESIRVPDQAPPFAVELEAICGLATLSRQDYDSSLIGLTTNSVLDHLLTSLAGIPQQRAMFSDTDAYLLAPKDIEPVTGTAGDTFLEDVSFGASTYDPQLGLRTIGTAEDMIVQICVMMNARLFMYRGKWLLMPIAKVMSTTSLLQNVLSSTKLGAVSSGSNIATPVTFNQSDRHRLGGEFYYLPAVRKITRDINYFGNTPFAGSRQLYPNQFRAVGHTTTGEPTSLVVSGSTATNIAADKTLKVRGFCTVILPWDYTSYPSYDPQSRLSRWRLELQVKCGNLYLSRNIGFDFSTTSVDASLLYDPPGGGVSGATIFNTSEPDIYEWTTDSASRVYFWTGVMRNGHAAYNGDPVTDEINFQFLTPTLGSAQAADISITMQVRGFNGVADASHPSAYTAQASLYNSSICRMFGDLAVYIGDGSDNGDVLTFGAELTNAATEEMRLPVGYYAEGPSDDIYNFSSAALTDTSGQNVQGFTSHNTTSTTALATLLCIDRLEHFGEQQECYHGDFQSEIILNPILSPRFLSKNWMITNMRHDGASDLYDLDLVAVKVLGSLDPDSVTEVRRSIELVHSPSDSITSVTDSVRKGRRDLSEEIADIETDVANISRTAGATGGDSSILLQYLGDVKISGPVNGQVLEYNTAAQRWANVTPSGGGGGLGGNDQTLSADRLIDLDSHKLTFADGSTTKMAISTADGVQVFGNFYVDSGTVAGGALRLNEASLLGSNYIQIQAPLSVTADTVLTLPDGAGSSGQALTTNGSGTLSWLDVVAKENPLVENVLTIAPLVSTSSPRLYIKGADNNGGVFLKVPNAISTNLTFTLPDTDGSSGQALITDGAGALSFATAGSDLLPLAKISGRWMWSSVDDGERVMTGSTAYGPFNWYSHSNEPSDATIRIYSSSHTVNQTSGSMPGFYLTAFGVPLGVDTKRVRVDFNFRVQNAPSGTTWGLSIWGANTPANGTTTNSTFTLRAVSSDISTTSINSTAFYSGTVTSTGVIANDYILPMFENRGGSLNSTTYIYGQINLYLVD